MKITTKVNTLLAMLVFLWGMASTTNAAIRHVPDEYSTIQAAISVSNNGDTVLVADGLYTGAGNRNINFHGRRITLRSENGPTNCIIDCEYASRAFTFDSQETNKSTLDGFTITRGYSPEGGAIYCYRSRPKVLNCAFRNNRAYRSGDYGGDGGAIFARRSSGLMLSNCAFIANSADVYGGGIFADVDSSLTVTNCTLAWNSAGKPGIYASGGGMFNGQRTSSNLINCIFWGNSATYHSGWQLSIAVNCTMWVSFCNIQGGNSPAALYVHKSSVYWGIGNIVTNPLLVSNDYRLIAGSPCINAGDPAFVSQPDETDIDGRPRIIGGRVDMGAYEFNHTPVADAGPDQTVYAWFDGVAKVILDGTGSYDDDGQSLSYLWSWTVDGNDFTATGPRPLIELPVGEYAIELTVSDEIDDSEPDEVVIIVIPPMETTMKLTPQVLNTNSQGKWVKAHFVLPEGFVVEDIDTNTPAIMEPFGIESEYMNVFVNEEDLVEIEIAFGRAALCGAVIDYGPAEVAIVGLLTSGQYFFGTDTIRVITRNLHYFGLLSSHWLEGDCGKPDWCSGCDLNQDSAVNFVDLAMFDGCCIEVIKK